MLPFVFHSLQSVLNTFQRDPRLSEFVEDVLDKGVADHFFIFGFFSMFPPIFRRFHEFFEVFGRVQTCSDPFGPFQTHSDTFGFIRMRSDAFGRFWKTSRIFGVFALIWDNFRYGCF